MLEKIKTIIWFLKDSSRHWQLLELIKRRLLYKSDNYGKIEALDWCQNKAVSTKRGFANLTKNQINFIDFNKTHNISIDNGKSIEKRCPILMGGGGDLNLLYNLTLLPQVTNILETGVAYGWSSLAVLSALNDKGNGKLYSTDMPYAKLNNENYVGCVVPNNLKDKWELIRKPDRIAIPQILDKVMNFDLCHYDSDKSYSGRKWAYPIIWNNLNDNGWFISDDISDNSAFMEFCLDKNIDPIIIEYDNKYIGVIHKTDTKV